MIEVAAEKPEIESTDFEAVFVNNRKLAQISAHLSRFNPIRVMRMERMEIRHSAILAWLLNPQESHGLSDQFLKAFLGEALRGQASLGFPTALDVVRADLRKAQIRREWQNIDILIHLPEEGWAFVVENKFDSRQHSGQLTRYIEKVKTLIQHDERELIVRGIFLTLHDEEPADPRYAPINYDMICEILPDVLTREAHSLTVEAKTFLNHYLEILEEELGVSQQRTEMEKLARELYREHKKVLDFVMEHGANSDFAIAMHSIAGDDPDREVAVTIDRKTYHFGWIENDKASFLPAQWYDGLGGERYDWEGCEDWWMGYPLVAWLQLVSDADGNGGQLRLYAEVGPLSSHEFRQALIEKIIDAAAKSGTDKVRFHRGAAEEGKRFSKFLKQNSLGIRDVQDADEIAVGAKKLLKKFEDEFELVGKLLPKFQKYGVRAQ